MPISVVDPIGDAFNRLGRILFRPFSIGKWFVLGFCAWLAYLGEGGGTGWTGGPPGGGGGGPPTMPSNVDWTIILSIVAITVALLLVIALVILWLRARGMFMFLDGVVRDRGAVVEPWKRYRKHGNSLFLFFICFMLCALLGIALIGGIGVVIAWPDIQSQQFGGAAITAIVISAALFLAFVIVLHLIEMALKDFIVPIMYKFDTTIIPAWSMFRHELLAGRGGTFTLYVLMKILIAIAVGTIAFTVTLLTCCLTIVPYLGTVILLPLFVFDRCYSLSFLEQFGPDWRFYQHTDRTNHCANCGYNLHGLPAHGVCPECGAPFGEPPDPPAPPTQPPPQA